MNDEFDTHWLIVIATGNQGVSIHHSSFIITY